METKTTFKDKRNKTDEIEHRRSSVAEKERLFEQVKTAHTEGYLVD